MGKWADQPVRGEEAAKLRAKALCDRAPRNSVVIEVGTRFCAMTVHAAAMRPDCRWIVVDNWLGAEDQPKRYRDTQDDNALKPRARADADRRRAYNTACGSRISVLCMDSISASKIIADGSCGLVWIDADHSYEGTKEDLLAWMPKVAPGGYIGGHDYKQIDPRFGGVDRAVAELFPGGVEEGENYTYLVKMDDFSGW